MALASLNHPRKRQWLWLATALGCGLLGRETIHRYALTQSAIAGSRLGSLVPKPAFTSSAASPALELAPHRGPRPSEDSSTDNHTDINHLIPEASASSEASRQPPGSSASQPSTADARAPSKSPKRGLFVRASKVLELSRGAAIPSGSFIEASGSRPAGLRLEGVSALGIGAEDGDILTEVAGQPVHSAGQVISLVAGARERRVSRISGVLYRGAEPIQLHVEMPYPRSKRGHALPR